MVNFTPGPSQLFFTVPDHMRKAFREGIPSLSHRTKEFEIIFSTTVNGLRELLNVPNNYHVAFTGSATEIWERIIQNLVVERSFHAVNGAFSKRFFEIAKQLGRKPVITEAPAGQGFDNWAVPDNVELIALTHNETSTGVSLPLPFIHSANGTNPNSLVVVDAVSSLPYPDLDYSKVDSVFFSVQKGFGLPAGLGVWLFNERCIERAEKLKSSGISIGSYHSLPSLRDHAVKNQTPETPNVLGIYLLGLVIADFLRKGIHSIRKETEYKSAVLYQALEKHALVQPFVKKASDRSKTVIVADCGDRTEALNQHLKARGLYAGDGYGEFKKRHLRFANFPAHAKEHFESLADAIDSFE
jgi:phosphoserine aminotransferase